MIYREGQQSVERLVIINSHSFFLFSDNLLWDELFRDVLLEVRLGTESFISLGVCGVYTANIKKNIKNIKHTPKFLLHL